MYLYWSFIHRVEIREFFPYNFLQIFREINKVNWISKYQLSKRKIFKVGENICNYHTAHTVLSLLKIIREINL